MWAATHGYSGERKRKAVREQVAQVRQRLHAPAMRPGTPADGLRPATGKAKRHTIVAFDLPKQSIIDAIRYNGLGWWNAKVFLVRCVDRELMLWISPQLRWPPAAPMPDRTPSSTGSTLQYREYPPVPGVPLCATYRTNRFRSRLYPPMTSRKPAPLPRPIPSHPILPACVRASVYRRTQIASVSSASFGSGRSSTCDDRRVYVAARQRSAAHG